MQNKRESFWRNKGFYMSVCTLLLCAMAVGTVYLRKQKTTKENHQMLADVATAVPEQDTDKKKVLRNQDAAQANARVKKNKIVKKKAASVTKKAAKESKKVPKKSVATNAKVNRMQHAFNEESGLLWPVTGKVLMKYSMNNSIYFKTLEQYKCNPAIEIAAKKGQQVKAAADGRVTKIDKDDEIGNIVTTDIGDGYRLTYGQLENISVHVGDELKEGDVIATVASPTGFFEKEGTNLYFQVTEDGKSVDPLLLLR